MLTECVVLSVEVFLIIFLIITFKKLSFSVKKKYFTEGFLSLFLLGADIEYNKQTAAQRPYPPGLPPLLLFLAGR